MTWSLTKWTVIVLLDWISIEWGCWVTCFRVIDNIFVLQVKVTKSDWVFVIQFLHNFHAECHLSLKNLPWRTYFCGSVIDYLLTKIWIKLCLSCISNQISNQILKYKHNYRIKPGVCIYCLGSIWFAYKRNKDRYKSHTYMLHNFSGRSGSWYLRTRYSTQLSSISGFCTRSGRSIMCILWTFANNSLE